MSPKNLLEFFFFFKIFSRNFFIFEKIFFEKKNYSIFVMAGPKTLNLDWPGLKRDCPDWRLRLSSPGMNLQKNFWKFQNWKNLSKSKDQQYNNSIKTFNHQHSLFLSFWVVGGYVLLFNKSRFSPGLAIFLHFKTFLWIIFFEFWKFNMKQFFKKTRTQRKGKDIFVTIREEIGQFQQP